MARVAARWESLPERLRERWEGVEYLARACFDKGMKVVVTGGDPEDVGPTLRELYPRAGLPFWVSGGAIYYSPLKLLAMTQGIAYGMDERYGTFRGDLHEFGHAVWYLLLTGFERWVRYMPLWALGPHLTEYAGTKAEEGWAEDFRVFWSNENEGFRQFRGEALARLKFVQGTMTRLRP